MEENLRGHGEGSPYDGTKQLIVLEKASKTKVANFDFEVWRDENIG